MTRPLLYFFFLVGKKRGRKEKDYCDGASYAHDRGKLSTDRGESAAHVAFLCLSPFSWQRIILSKVA